MFHAVFVTTCWSLQEVHAADEAAEEEFRDAQENYSVGDPHAEYHAAGTYTLDIKQAVLLSHDSQYVQASDVT